MADNAYDPIGARAAFAQNFQNTTNLDQRRRFAQDISEAKKRDDERKQQAFEAAQQANPQLMNAVTNRQRENRAAREGFIKNDLARQRLEFEQGRESRANDLAQKQLQLRMNQENRLAIKAQMDIDRQDREDTDMLEAEQTEMRLREEFGPGSTQYRDGLMEAAIRYKYLPKDYRNTMLQSAGWQDPEVAFRNASDMVAQNPGSKATGVPIPGGGGAKITLAGPKPQAPDKQIDVDAELAKAFAARDRAKQHEDEDYRIFTENRIKELQAMKQGQSVAKASSSPKGAQPMVLTLDIAKSLLQEAGGDKDKARALAKERGYKQ